MVQRPQPPRGSVRRTRPERIAGMNRPALLRGTRAAGRSADICLSSSHTLLTTRSQMGDRRRSPAPGREPGPRIPLRKPIRQRPNRREARPLCRRGLRAGRCRTGGSGAARRADRTCRARTARQASTRLLARPGSPTGRMAAMTGTFVCCMCGRRTLLAAGGTRTPRWECRGHWTRQSACPGGRPAHRGCSCC